MVVQVILTRSSDSIATTQIYVPILSSTLLVELVQATTNIYFSVFQLRISDCVINQKIHYPNTGGSGLLMWNLLLLLMIRLLFRQVKNTSKAHLFDFEYSLNLYNVKHDLTMKIREILFF